MSKTLLLCGIAVLAITVAGADAGEAKNILANGCNLDVKNPSAKQDFEHLPPEQLADDIMQKELRIAEIMQEIKSLLAEARP